MTPEAFIIDLGGVIIDIDYQATVNALQLFAQESKTAEVLAQNAYKHPLFLDYEIGKINTETFFEGLRTEFSLNATNAQLFEAWNAMLGNIAPEKTTFLAKLSSQKPTFLLSNTNEVHLQGVEAVLQHQTTHQTLAEVFTKTYYSFTMQARKPSSEIFQAVLSENQLDPSKTLFLDDSEEHVNAAKTLGLQTWLVPRNSRQLLALVKFL